MSTKTKNAPHKRRKAINNNFRKTNPIIAWLTEEPYGNYPRWFEIFFGFAFLTFLSLGSTIIVPLMWLGVL